MSNIIEVKNLTKDYGDGHGIFDLNFSIKKVKYLDLLEPMEVEKLPQ